MAVGEALADAIDLEHGAHSCGAKPSCHAHQMAGQEDDQEIGGLAQDREQDQGAQDLRGVADHLPVEQEIAQTLRGAHQLGRDHEHPGEAEPAAHAGEPGGQGGRIRIRRISANGPS